MLTARIKYHTDGVNVYQAHEGEWVDVCAAEDLTMVKGCNYLIPLGFSLALPEGYEAILAARSSSYNKFGFMVTNGIGVIDHKYCGNEDEWKLSVHAVHAKSIKKGDRIAQFRIQKQQPDFILKEVDDLGNENRGGFGSTG